MFCTGTFRYLLTFHRGAQALWTVLVFERWLSVQSLQALPSSSTCPTLKRGGGMEVPAVPQAVRGVPRADLPVVLRAARGDPRAVRGVLPADCSDVGVTDALTGTPVADRTDRMVAGDPAAVRAVDRMAVGDPVVVRAVDRTVAGDPTAVRTADHTDRKADTTSRTVLPQANRHPRCPKPPKLKAKQLIIPPMAQIAAA